MLAAYADALGFLEHSAHSAWLFTIANLLHVLGAAFLVGGIGAFDLQVLRDRGKGAAAVGPGSPTLLFCMPSSVARCEATTYLRAPRHLRLFP